MVRELTDFEIDVVRKESQGQVQEYAVRVALALTSGELGQKPEVIEFDMELMHASRLTMSLANVIETSSQLQEQSGLWGEEQ